MKTTSKILIAACAFVTAAPQAFAQPEERLRQGVIERPRPAFEAKGIRLGSFLVYPAVDLSIVFDDNIFEADTTEVDDFAFRVEPQVSVESNFSRHALNFRGQAGNTTFFDEGSENRTDYFLGLDGRLDIVETTNIRGEVSFEEDTEDRGSPDSIGAAVEPIEFSTFRANAALNHNPGRFSATVGGTFNDIDYDDVALLGGGAQNNDDRDRQQYGVFARTGLEVSPGYEVFVLGIYNEIDYDDAVDDFGLNRDSQGFQVEGGARFEVTNVVAGEAAFGYSKRNYDDPALSTISGLSAEVDVEWYVTRLTTILFGASRRIQETTLFGSSGYFETAIDVGVDHELLRNVILSAYYRYSNRDYESIVREDDVHEAIVRAVYLLNRNFSIAGEYKFETRDTNIPGFDFDRNVVAITLRSQI